MVTRQWQLSRRSKTLFALGLLWLGGCLGQTGRFEQALARVDELEARVGTIETTITENQSQGQQGLINIASMGPGLGAYIGLTLMIIVAWKLWRRLRYWKRTTGQVVQIIEEQKGYTQGVRQRLAKDQANQTPFGRLVQCLTSASRNSSSTPSA